jgi:hypothetical protein
MHIHIVNLCMHVPVIPFIVYKIPHNYFLFRIIVMLQFLPL